MKKLFALALIFLILGCDSKNRKNTDIYIGKVVKINQTGQYGQFYLCEFEDGKIFTFRSHNLLPSFNKNKKVKIECNNSGVSITEVE